MSTHYSSVGDIPSKTCYALADDGELIMMFSGVPSAWIRADLGARNVTANLQNNR